MDVDTDKQKLVKGDLNFNVDTGIISNTSNVFFGSKFYPFSLGNTSYVNLVTFLLLKPQIFSLLQLNVLLKLLTVFVHLWKFLLIRDTQLINVNFQYLIPPLGLSTAPFPAMKISPHHTTVLVNQEGVVWLFYRFLWALKNFEKMICSLVVAWILKTLFVIVLILFLLLVYIFNVIVLL